MRSFSNLSKFTGIILVVAVLALGGLNYSSVQAGVPAQTATAPAGDTVATTAASSNTSATAAAGMTYPPCPPVGNATAAATVASGGSVATAAAAAATTAATAQAAVPTAVATVNTNPGYLGVRAEQVDDCGVLIVEIVTDSPADKAKLQTDDVIVALDGVATPAIALLR